MKHWKRHFAPQVARRGTTLIELLVVFGVAATIAGLGITAIQLLLRAERDFSRAAWRTAVVGRLAEVFRDDVRHTFEFGPLAESEGPLADPKLLELELFDGHNVRYEIDSHLLSRIESDKGEVVHHERFAFRPESTLRIEREADAAVLRIVIEESRALDRDPQRRSGRMPAPVREFSIESVLPREARAMRGKP
jgi:hypothetical protein